MTRRLEALRRIEDEERLEPEVRAPSLGEADVFVIGIQRTERGFCVRAATGTEDHSAAHRTTSWAISKMSSSDIRTTSAAAPSGM